MKIFVLTSPALLLVSLISLLGCEDSQLRDGSGKSSPDPDGMPELLEEIEQDVVAAEGATIEIATTQLIIPADAISSDYKVRLAVLRQAPDIKEVLFSNPQGEVVEIQFKELDGTLIRSSRFAKAYEVKRRILPPHEDEEVGVMMVSDFGTDAEKSYFIGADSLEIDKGNALVEADFLVSLSLKVTNSIFWFGYYSSDSVFDASTIIISNSSSITSIGKSGSNSNSSSTEPIAAPFLTCLNPTWIRSDILTNYEGVSRLIVVDTDLDGDLDLIASSDSSGQLQKLENKGGLNFESSVISIQDGTYNSTSPIWGLGTVVDLDKEGSLDLVFGDNNKVWMYQGIGSASPSFKVLSQNVRYNQAPPLADFDGDGDLDLIAYSWGKTTENGSALRILENSNNFSSSQPHLIANVPEDPRSIKVVDADNDGDPDIFATDVLGKVYYIANNGGFSFETTVIQTESTNKLIDLVPIDLDRDGKLDLIYSNPSVLGVHWIRDINGIERSETTIGDFSGPERMQIIDFDGDGDLDILASVTSQSKLLLLVNDGEESFTTSTIDASASGLRYTEIGDFDNDGYLDFVSPLNASDRIALYKQECND